MKYNILRKTVLGLILVCSLFSCSDYLDKEPDDQLDLKSVFENKDNMERWLSYIYIAIPSFYNYDGENAIADDMVPSVGWEAQGFAAIQYQKGNWTPNDEKVITYWLTLPKQIRSAYLFMKYAHPVSGVSEKEVNYMKAECRFFIGYFHSLLAMNYGSVPIIRNASETTSTGDMMLKQEPFDNVVNWAANEMYEASKELPTFYDESQKYGRITSIMCLAMRARLLLFAASDLTNGNPDMANMKNIDGTSLFSATKDPKKWETAKNALLELIELAEGAGHKLHVEYLTDGVTIDPFLSYQNAIMKRKIEGNNEILFPRTYDSGGYFDKQSTPRGMGLNGVGAISVTQSLVDAFFMKDGVRPILGYNADGSPIKNAETTLYSEDGYTTADEKYATNWKYGSANGSESSNSNLIVAKNTFKMYSNREPRFYISVLYNEEYHRVGKRNCDFFMDGRDGGPSQDSPWTGYLIRKLIDPTANPKESSGTYKSRHGIIYRLAEAYLSYAEALNEWSILNGTYSTNQPEILRYINRIRERAGIPLYSIKGGTGTIQAPSSGEEMRSLIRQERRVELNCEAGIRFADLRRWKQKEALDGNFYGMNAYATASERDKYYKRTVYQTRKFKSYWFPVPQSEVDKNLNLVQTPDWK